MDDSGDVVTTATTAARYVGGHAIDVAPVVQQAPGPGEVRMDVACTGVCGTDPHIVHEDMDQRVTVPAQGVTPDRPTSHISRKRAR